MAVLLRQGAAARRLGGSISMVQRAEAEGRRRLVHTGKLPREEALREIQQKKEELYDLIAKAEQSFSTRSFQNLRLQQHLSVQVSPRPWDWEWRHLRFSRRVNSVMETAGFIALGGLAAYAKNRYDACLAARERLWAEVMEEEEEAKA